MSKTVRNELLLVLTAMIWGLAFVFQTTGGNAVGPFTFSCLRSVIASFALLPVVKLMDRMGMTERRPHTKAEWRMLILGGICNGMALAATSFCQQLGMYWGTPAGKAGFLTACYIVLVPVLGLFLKKRCGWNVAVAVAITLGGLYLLCMNGELTLQTSDIMVLLCSLACAVHILCVDHFGPKVDVVRMSLLQFMVAALIASVPMFMVEMKHSAAGIAEWAKGFQSPDAWIGLLYVGMVSSAVGYTLQCVGQQDVNPTIASLLMSLESVVSVIASWILLGQVLSGREITGCALIFAAVVFAQIPVRRLTKRGSVE